MHNAQSMKSRWALRVVLGFLLCVALPVAVGGGELSPKPGSENPIAVGQLAWIEVKGLTTDQLKDAAMHLFPRKGVMVIPGQTWSGEPYIIFQASQQGEYLLAVCVAVGGKVESCEYVVQVGEAPPGPGPGPAPKPKPDPHPVPQSDIAQAAASLVAKVQGTNTEEIANVRKVYAAMADEIEKIPDPVADSRVATPQQAMDVLKKDLARVLGDRLDAWAVFFTGLKTVIDKQFSDGKLPSTVFGVGKACRQIAEGLAQ